jgi:mannitol-1-phosphate 5-dehydrogenase
MMTEHILTGFGFGPIQAGLFVKEAFQSRSFKRLVVAEIDTPLLDSLKASKGSYFINIARADGIETLRIDNVELLNPNVPADKKILLEALARSTEITTCLPSVNFYGSQGDSSVASLIAHALKNRKTNPAVVYTAENNNHAAEILQKAVAKESPALPESSIQFLNTVIGKMSRVVTDPAEIKDLNLKTIVPGLNRAFLVEQFNKILVTKARIPGFRPGIDIFIEKDDLLPFEEAKLYGHNAVHALLGFIGALKGYTKMTELANDPPVMQIAEDAFLNESGAALIEKHSRLGDRLFTRPGFREYAEDLLTRMTNPYLGDTIERVARDIPRKLEISGRVFGTMQLILQHNLQPKNIALAAIAGIALLLENAHHYNLPPDLQTQQWQNLDIEKIPKILNWLWSGQKNRHTPKIINHTHSALKHLKNLINE